MNKFPALRFAVAAGIFLSLHAVIVTISAMAGIPGIRPFAELLTQFYGPYGYSIFGTGIIVGALLGFSEGFSLVLSIVSLILLNRSFSTSLIAAFRRPNPTLAWILLMITVILSLSLLWPAASALFRFGPLHVDDLALTLAAGIVVLIILETLKHQWRARLGL